MWYEVENGNLARPSDVDTTSSHNYVYVRRNITLVDEERDENNEIIVPQHYRWEEMKIPRNMWEVCSTVQGHSTALDDVYDALTELAELIVEG